jgi:hypothetical protein
MNAEFHYYALYYACVRAGLPEERARTIASSSQYVDDAISPWLVEEGGREYLTQVTQNYSFWDEATLREVYLPFHFLPRGCEEEGAPGSRWAAAPDCPLAKELLVAALRSGDDYRLGIALHAYADGWAHQGFSGRLEAGNAIDPSSPLPAVGHLQVLRAPDDPAGEWEDPRLGPGRSLVVNSERFLAAARKIYRYLRTSLRLGFEEEELALEPLARLWREGPRDARERVSDYSVELDIPPYDRRDWLAMAGMASDEADEGPIGGYDRLRWLGAELRGRAGLGSRPRTLRAGSSFIGSPLHLWNEAARAHREAALALLAGEGLL